MEKLYLYIYILIFFFLLTSGCKVENNKESRSPVRVPFEINVAHYKLSQYNGTEVPNRKRPAPVNFDLDKIKKRGKLIALTGGSNISYFMYKGVAMGYEYELLRLLAAHLKVRLEIVVVSDLNKAIDMLNRGQGDIIADHLTVTREQDKLVTFTQPYHYTRQVLIQRKPENWMDLSAKELDNYLLRNPVELIGKEVYVRKASTYQTRLENLSDEIGGDIHIKGVPGEIGMEELIRKVAEGVIPYTVANEDLASVYKLYYPEIDIAMPLSFTQRVAWAVRENSPQLLNEVNDWIGKIKKAPTYYTIYNKYYNNPVSIRKHMLCSRSLNCSKRISPYDKLIIKYSKEIDWDWRLLASLIYQESQFNPAAKSFAGATGLMQLMPKTAAIFGVTNPEDPIESLRAGVSYIKWLDNYWKKKVPDKKERLKFVMASYNVGMAHVEDAQRLAIKYNRNPLVWDDNVAYFILMKAQPEYSRDPVVKYGYCRGEEPFNYVKEVFERFEHYKKLVKEQV